MSEVLTVLVCVSLVFALYWLVGCALRWDRRKRMKRQGKSISWELALEQVRGGDGFFIVAVSGQKRELCYAPGDLPSDTGSVRDAFNYQADLVEGYCGGIAVPDLMLNGIGDRCIELNIEALDV